MLLEQASTRQAHRRWEDEQHLDEHHNATFEHSLTEKLLDAVLSDKIGHHVDTGTNVGMCFYNQLYGGESSTLFSILLVSNVTKDLKFLETYRDIWLQQTVYKRKSGHT